MIAESELRRLRNDKLRLELLLMTPDRYQPIPGLVYPALLALLADTHVPDRVSRLPDSLLDALEKTKPAYILHAGDISVPSVLETLSEISPVLAARGNRDFLIKPRLAIAQTLVLGGVKVVLTHGHGSVFRYLSDKVKYLHSGYAFERYRTYFERDFPGADLILFGHTHTPEEVRLHGRCYLNPGATYACASNDFKPRLMLLKFPGDGLFSYRSIFF